MKHLIFYDAECPLCNRAIRFILTKDHQKQFYFAPLNGKTAEQKISHFFLKNPDLDTLVLLQDYETDHEMLLVEGRGALRILWLLGGKYRLIGWLSFLHPFLFDPIYRLIARYRYKLFSIKTPLPQSDEHFLP